MSVPPFQHLLDAHGRDVHRFLIGVVGRGDADDCYQETWLSALRAYPGLRDSSNLRGWIFTVAHRKALDHLRSRTRGTTPLADVPDSSTVTAAPFDGSLDLWAHVAQLPAKQRAALTLRFVADAPYREIAAVMSTSEEAARRNVHEALKRLRMEYQR